MVEPYVRSYPSLEVRRSAIHGRGLFTTVAIEAGALIGRYTGRRTTRAGAHVLWLEGEDGAYVGVSGRNELRFVNHAPEPNAQFEGLCLYARRRIRAHEEITLDYGHDWAREPGAGGGGASGIPGRARAACGAGAR